MKTVHTVKTKLNKDDKNPVITVLTLDWSGATVEALQGPAADTLIINKQGQWRRAKKIPPQHEEKVMDLIARMGSRSSGPVTVESTAAQAAALDSAGRDALIKKLLEQQKADELAKRTAAKAPKAPVPTGKPENRPQA